MELGMYVIKLYPSHNNYVFRYRMTNKLCKILQEIVITILEMNTFRFEFKLTMSLKWRQTNSTFPAIPRTFRDKDKGHCSSFRQSRANEKKEIVETLLGQSSNVGLMVLPIRSLFKMTPLFRSISRCGSRCVSNFDVDFLTKRIVQATKENGCQVNGNSTLNKIKDALSEKRYLLELDDVWNRDANKWKVLKMYINDGGKGSSVMTS
ncbi:hypothetical protein U9M48_030079 [Paspalum notatum var. saurae]|uniref:NB-ARC domain-containing protein n=1 Tax=Paspalum notatum var. saurae TaxID=547442 RepID=A0AAQ3X3D6_PASNO